MSKNVGNIDRAVRILIGLALIAWGLTSGTWWGAVGAVPLLTALMGFCPLYAPLGINTCPRNRT
jgi:hypothetical protein